jgi:hypothetical protein
MNDSIYDALDDLPPLQELDEPLPMPTHILPSSTFTAVDFHIPPTTAGFLTDFSRTQYSRSPSASHLYSPLTIHPGSGAGQDFSMLTPTSMAASTGYHSPAITESNPRRNRRMLVDHFRNDLSQLLTFKEEPGNPFRDLIVPMSARSEPVLNAIYAVSAAHLEQTSIATEERALDFHSRSLQGLAQLIADRATGRDEALAVIVLLLYYEVIPLSKNGER